MADRNQGEGIRLGCGVHGWQVTYLSTHTSAKQIVAMTNRKKKTFKYEGCSNTNANSFIIFVTYMLRQNGICFYKGLFVTFKLAPGLKKNTVYTSSCSPLNEGHFSILTNSMLRTYQ